MILVTGANGFIGRAVIADLRSRKIDAVGAVRREPGEGEVEVGNIGPDTDWKTALPQVDCIIHTAARVHVMRETTNEPLERYRAVNVAGTVNLARQACEAGASRFIYLSSIKVIGEFTTSGMPFTADNLPNPSDPYATSKREAEDALRSLSRETGLEVVIIRPPLVYGPGVKGNFERMMRWISRGLPLPLGAINNRRSLAGLGNLTDLIMRCIDHPDAANQTLLVCDGEDLSTTALLVRLGDALGTTPRLIPVPESILKSAARLLGKEVIAQRLIGSLQIDITKTRDLLGWQPPYTVDEELRRTARAFSR